MNNINENLIANTNFRIWILNCRGGEIKRKIMPDATVLKENKYGKSLCDTEVLWCKYQYNTKETNKWKVK